MTHVGKLICLGEYQVLLRPGAFWVEMQNHFLCWGRSLQTAPLQLHSIDCLYFCHSKCSTVYLALCPLFALCLVIKGDVNDCIMSIEWGKGTIANILCGTGSPIGANIPVSIKISSSSLYSLVRRLLPRTGKELGRFDHVLRDIPCMVLIIESLPTHSEGEVMLRFERFMWHGMVKDVRELVGSVDYITLACILCNGWLCIPSRPIDCSYVFTYCTAWTRIYYILCPCHFT